jgi:integrase
MLQLGAELRLGQVRTLARSDVEFSTEGWLVTVPSHGRKRGVRLYLTPEQNKVLDEALAGYLAEYERDMQGDLIEDYYLFPGRDGMPISRSWVRQWFREAEKIAGIKHVKGRGAYGLRRAGVDGAKQHGADRDALKEFGGWTDTQMPDRVYADAEQEAAGKRARDIRRKVRSA